MNYVPHPYAVAAPSPSSRPDSSKTRPKRPTITTASSSPASFFSSTSPTTSPSPITFARASLISPLTIPSQNSGNKEDMHSQRKASENEKRDRRRGLMKAEGSTHAHAALDALLRAPEAAPRAAPKTLTPRLVRSPTSTSVTPTIQRLQNISRPDTNLSDEKVSERRSTRTPRPASPTTSSGSGSAPSTPGQPRTPVSIVFDDDNGSALIYPVITVAPLTICKASLTSSPAPPTKLQTQPQYNSRTPSPTGQPSAPVTKRRSRGRFHSRTSSITPADRIFAPLEIDTDAARSLNLSLESPRGVPTLTGVLAEFEREVSAVHPVPVPPVHEVTKDDAGDDELDEDDESDWLDISSDQDPLEDAEFYRADIASHLQLFSSYTVPPTSRRPSYARHTRGPSSSSISRWQRQLPPARPDSLPPPPHFLSSLRETTDEDPSSSFSPECVRHSAYRRASASSLASTASGRSTGSTSSRSKPRSAGKIRAAKRYSVARRSAMVGVGRRRSSGALQVNVDRPLPAIPCDKAETEKDRILGPSALLDPTYSLAPSLLEIEKERGEKMHRPPPRFSIPVSVRDEDVFGDDIIPPVPRPSVDMRMRMDSLIEEDEDDGGLLDPFVLDKFPMINPFTDCKSAPKVEGITISSCRDKAQLRMELGGVDPFTCSSEAANVPASSLMLPSTSTKHAQSPQSRAQNLATTEAPSPGQPLLLIPQSPTAASTVTTSSNETFDAETLYSSYATLSPRSSCISPLSETNDAGNARKGSAGSVYLDSQGRPLQSRWSVSTFASVAPPTSSSTRSFFPKLANAATTVPSRLSARLKAARERAILQAKEKEEKEKREGFVRPYPFFPTPTPPSPKRRTSGGNGLGPGKYVPKPELMPQQNRASGEEERKLKSNTNPSTSSPRSSSEANHSSTSVATPTSSTKSPKGRAKEIEGCSPQYATQFAQYRTFRQQQQSSPTAQSQTSSSPPRSLMRSRTSSTDSLSAFPFVLGGDRLSSESSSGRRSAEGNAEANFGSGSGLKRKPIPLEIFPRA